jgi:hypothetical protein
MDDGGGHKNMPGQERIDSEVQSSMRTHSTSQDSQSQDRVAWVACIPAKMRRC